MKQGVRRCPDTMKQNFQELLCYLDHVFRASVLHNPGLGLLRIVINRMHLLLVRWIWQRLIRCWVMPQFNIGIKNILTRVRSIIWPSISSSICQINQGIPKVRFPSHLCKMQHKKQQSIRLTMAIKIVVTVAFSSSKTYHKSMKTDIFF
jgi:hypothetical protein